MYRGATESMEHSYSAIIYTFYIKVLQDLVSSKDIMYHRDISLRQRNSYNQMKSDVENFKATLFIEVDFKQKVVIGEYFLNTTICQESH